MKKSITTWLGLLTAVFAVITPIINNGTFDIHKDWINLVGAALAAAFGYFAEDVKPKDKQ